MLHSTKEIQATLKQLNRDIRKAKARLQGRPLCENWGSTESRKLWEKYSDYTHTFADKSITDALNEFDNWCTRWHGNIKLP